MRQRISGVWTMTRDSIVFYRSFYESIKDLPPEQFKACALAILEYGLDGKEPEGNGPEKMAYLLTKPQIDANNRRYQNGTKGGRKKTEVEPESNQTETKPEPKPNQIETKPEPNENVKEKDNVKEKENIKTFRPPTAADVEEYALEKGLKDVYKRQGCSRGCRTSNRTHADTAPVAC